jgi:uncharacterized protein YkwD
MRRSASLLALVALCLLGAPSGAAAAQPGCLHEDARLTDRNRDEVERALLCLTNVYRVRSGLEPYRLDTRLGSAARAHSQDMHDRRYFGHTSPPPGSTTPTTRAQAAGYPVGGSTIGENIAYNTTGTAHALLIQWQESPGHNANLLNADASTAGMGVADCRCRGLGGITGTQMFSVRGANTGFTGLDHYVADPEGCVSGRSARRSAARAVARLERALAAAKTRERRAALRAKLRRKRAQLQAARSRTTTACAGQSP